MVIRVHKLPWRQRGLVRIAEAQEILAIGRTKLWQLASEGVIETRQIGASRLVTTASLARIIDGEDHQERATNAAA